MVAVQSYARCVEPHRPFVLTCRALEYSQLSPDFVDGSEHVVLVGLEHDQVAEILSERARVLVAWEPIRSAHAAHDPTVVELLRSPLRLTAALQAYERNDPGELLDLDLEAAKGRLWDRLLETHGPTFRGASGEQAKHWLTFLARGVRRTGRQRFVLHELYLMDPADAVGEQRFRLGLAVALGTLAALIGAWSVGPVPGMLAALAYGVQIARSFERVPSVLVAASWNERAARARMRLSRAWTPGLVGGCLLGAAVGAWRGWFAGAILAGGVVLVFVGVMLVFTLRESIEPLAAGPPGRFAGKQLDATLAESRDHGLSVGFLCGVFYGAVTALVSAVTTGVVEGLLFAAAVAVSGLLLRAGLVPLLGAVAGGLAISQAPPPLFGLLVGLAVGLLVALRGGFGAWCYHYWVRLRLARRHALPYRLLGFLAWCAGPERSWLRISDACEFRHRELLEFLAGEASGIPSTSSPHGGHAVTGSGADRSAS